MANGTDNLGVLDKMLVGISQCKEGILNFHSELRALRIQLKERQSLE